MSEELEDTWEELVAIILNIAMPILEEMRKLIDLDIL